MKIGEPCDDCAWLAECTQQCVRRSPEGPLSSDLPHLAARLTGPAERPAAVAVTGSPRGGGMMFAASDSRL
ncbi:hypothetical protein [Brevundimonas sp. UBA7664]|uniref:hypothetical protein n=1 Tax=Brevundimonas sp. UBA7664 TaxID=1946141 RepID=UPI0025C33934|nr:hypothetical protein [Brevundimonas sp. UBA7664]